MAHHPSLFRPLSMGQTTVPNRIWMAPLTRCRAGVDHLPNPLMAEYYAQRASAGLIIAEATMAMEQSSAFWKEPGIYSQAQIAAWQHGSKLLMQYIAPKAKFIYKFGTVGELVTLRLTADANQ